MQSEPGCHKGGSKGHGNLIYTLCKSIYRPEIRSELNYVPQPTNPNRLLLHRRFYRDPPFNVELIVLLLLQVRESARLVSDLTGENSSSIFRAEL